jgi:hypothetical protein
MAMPRKNLALDMVKKTKREKYIPNGSRIYCVFQKDISRRFFKKEGDEKVKKDESARSVR